MTGLYRRGEGATFARDSRKVVVWRNKERGTTEAHFRCPCGHRLVAVHSPPHGIDFDGEGVLTVKGSVGSREGGYWMEDERRQEYWPANNCHFWVEGGVPRMAGDAGCPGSQDG